MNDWPSIHAATLSLLVAPETLVVDLALAALLALERALRLQHPRLDVDPTDDPQLRSRARIILGLAPRLRCSLRAYRHAVERRLRDEWAEDFPF